MNMPVKCITEPQCRNVWFFGPDTFWSQHSRAELGGARPDCLNPKKNQPLLGPVDVVASTAKLILFMVNFSHDAEQFLTGHGQGIITAALVDDIPASLVFHFLGSLILALGPNLGDGSTDRKSVV